MGAPPTTVRFLLVYHGSVVAYWYWGDDSNKIPSV